MQFSYEDYKDDLAAGSYPPPTFFQPFMQVDRTLYHELENRHAPNKHETYGALRKVHKRVGDEYFHDVRAIQCKSLDYSQLAFPAYRFILPEVLANDWLASVDWRKFNRDHVLHQPLTAYIVLKLLTGGNGQGISLPDDRSLLNACVDEILKWGGTAYIREQLVSAGVQADEVWLEENRSPGRKMWEALFVETAYLAAIFHDIGYPWQYIAHLDRMLDRTGSKGGTPRLDPSGVLGSVGRRLLCVPLRGYRLPDEHTPSTWPARLRRVVASALNKTHGLPGALTFLHLNDSIRCYPDSRVHPIRQFCVEWAAMAIMMHDLKAVYWGNETSTVPDNAYLRLQADVDPLSCIVTLADILQDFARPCPTWEPDSGRSATVTYEEGSSRSELNFCGRTGQGEIVYYCDRRDQFLKKGEFLSDDRHEYFDPEHGYLDLSALGVGGITLRAKMIP